MRGTVAKKLRKLAVSLAKPKESESAFKLRYHRIKAGYNRSKRQTSVKKELYNA